MYNKNIYYVRCLNSCLCGDGGAALAFGIYIYIYIYIVDLVYTINFALTIAVIETYSHVYTCTTSVPDCVM